ncbi:MAG: translation initiation factor IF-3 [Bacteroidota bacterium]
MNRREHRINQEIRAPRVRVVGSEDENDNGVLSLRDALDLADDKGVDVVEINPKPDPPIVRLIEYSKFKYEEEKRKKRLKDGQDTVKMKEIRFGPNTDEHDFNFKLKHAEKFLDEGNKVKAFVFFRGRSIIYTDRGKKLLLEFAQALEERAKVEMLPKLEGKRMYLILSPKKGKK